MNRTLTVLSDERFLFLKLTSLASFYDVFSCFFSNQNDMRSARVYICRSDWNFNKNVENAREYLHKSDIARNLEPFAEHFVGW